ncbi:MAG: hypothetical protein R3C53_02415 [Pirellulaceae bacterium]
MSKADPSKSQRQTQFSIFTLFVVLTFAAFIMAYVTYAGWIRLFNAIVPPILIAAFLNSIRGGVQFENLENARKRLLGCLVFGYAIWIPIYLTWEVSRW